LNDRRRQWLTELSRNEIAAIGGADNLLSIDPATKLRERLERKLRETKTQINSRIGSEFVQMSTELAVCIQCQCAVVRQSRAERFRPTLTRS
jgi:hypothetical protein